MHFVKNTVFPIPTGKINAFENAWWCVFPLRLTADKWCLGIIWNNKCIFQIAFCGTNPKKDTCWCMTLSEGFHLIRFFFILFCKLCTSTKLLPFCLVAQTHLLTFPISLFSLYWFNWIQSCKETGRDRVNRGGKIGQHETGNNMQTGRGKRVLAVGEPGRRQCVCCPQIYQDAAV